MYREQAIDRLREYVHDAGSQAKAAKALNISPRYLSDVLNGRRDPQCVLARINIRRVVMYEGVDPE